MNTIMNLLSNLMDILSNLNGSTIFLYLLQSVHAYGQDTLTIMEKRRTGNFKK